MLGRTITHTGYTCSSQAKLGRANSLYPFLHLQLRSVSVAFLPLKRQQKKEVSDLVPGGGGELAVPVWPSLTVASSRPVPDPCHVTGPSTSRSQPGSARRADRGHKHTGHLKDRLQPRAEASRRRCGDRGFPPHASHTFL